MIFWITDLLTGDTLSGGLSESQVSQFIKFNMDYHLLENMVVQSGDGGMWSANAWLLMRG